MDLIEHILGEEGYAHVRYAFGESRTLGQCLSACVDLKQGSLRTYLPLYVTEAEVIEFSASKQPVGMTESHRYQQADGQWVLMTRVESTIRVTSASLHSHLIQNPNSIAIFEDWMVDRTDSCVQNERRCRFAFCGNEVYTFSKVPEATVDDVEFAIRKAESIYPPLMGVVCDLPSDELTLWEGDRVEKRPDDFERLAERVRIIIVGAYDGEGYLIWKKRE